MITKEAAAFSATPGIHDNPSINWRIIVILIVFPIFNGIGIELFISRTRMVLSIRQ